jgi:hypothetical protein
MESIENFYLSHRVDDDFDEFFYQKSYPNVMDFLCHYCDMHNIDNRHRLFYHYAVYGRKLGWKKKPKICYAKPVNGLCNRLLLLDSIYSFAIENHFDQINVCWEKSPGFSDEKFDELFDMSYLPKIFSFVSDEQYISAIENKDYLVLENFFTQNQETLEYSFTIDMSVLIDKIANNNFCYHGYASLDWIFKIQLINRYVLLQTAIKPHPKLLSKINSLQINDSYIGLHIRRTDAINSPWSKQYLKSDDNLFHEIIKNNSKNIFLSTDSKNTTNKFVNTYPDKNLKIHKKKFVDEAITMHEHKPHQSDAVVDLFCLSRASKIYGTNWSTFSMVASILGNKDLEIVSEQNLNVVLAKHPLPFTDDELRTVSNKLECILLLLSEHEINNHLFEHFLEQIDRSMSHKNNRSLATKIDMKILINTKIKNLDITTLNKYFKSVEIIYSNIPAKLDFYETSINAYKNYRQYGMKSGPNYMFFEAFKYLSKYNTTLFLECDCILRNDWLKKIYQYTEYAGGFWISGGCYGVPNSENLYSTLNTHINGGVALYATGNNFLLRFLQHCDKLFPYFLALDPTLAYDYYIRLLIDIYSQTRDNDNIRFINRQYLINNLILNYSTHTLDKANHNLSKYDYAIAHIKPHGYTKNQNIAN